MRMYAYTILHMLIKKNRIAIRIYHYKTCRTCGMLISFGGQCDVLSL